MSSFLILPLVFGVTCLGLGWPIATRLNLAPAEKLVASVFLSLLGVFLASWLVYTANLPHAVLWSLPALALGALAFDRGTLLIALRDDDGKRMLSWQLVIMAWCLGWLVMIFSYSGGGWAADWIEHWERTRFILERLPHDFRLIGLYSFTARPPLVNAVTAAFLAINRADFAHFQVVMTLLGCLAFLPTVLLARRFGAGPGLIGRVAVLFMLSPLFVQNATFAWTKLPTGFFVLVALRFFLHAWDHGASKTNAALFAAALAAGALAHYSAGPYIVVLGAAWLLLAKNGGSWLAPTLLAAGIGIALLALWFGWAFANYGTEMFLSNSSVVEAQSYHGSQLAKIGLNLRDTIIPHFLRSPDSTLIVQASSLGQWRDWWFQLYQLNLFFAFGSTGWLVLLVALVREWRHSDASHRRFWLVFVCTIILLGVAVHGARDTWGLMHICLQPLVLLGLGYLAARWQGLSTFWKRVLVAGVTIDFLLGIILQQTIQSWLVSSPSMNVWLFDYGESVRMNLAAKLTNQVMFLSDVLSPPPLAVFLFLGALLATSIYFVTRRMSGGNAEKA